MRSVSHVISRRAIKSTTLMSRSTAGNITLTQTCQVLMSIDPSICDLGYAIFQTRQNPKTATLLLADNIAQHSSEDFDIRSDAAASILTRIASNYQVTEVAIELPDHYSSGKGEAAKNSDSILKLMFCVATIRARFRPIPVILIPVRKWKGSQPKHLTQRRIANHWQFRHENHNICDAVGIGDWLLRKRRGYRPLLISE